MRSNISFSVSLFALLNYYRTGDKQTFKIIIKKALDYWNVKTSDDSQLVRFSNLLFDRLSIFGFIERYSLHRRIIWNVCNKTIISIGDDNYLIIGDEVFINTVSHLSNCQYTEHKIYRFPTEYNFGFKSLSFPLIKFKYETIKEISESLMANLVDNEYLSLFFLLPNLKNVYSNSLSEIGYFINENSSVNRFNFNECRWIIESNTDTLTKSGYYKITNKFSYSIYAIHYKNKTLQITENDWGFLIACLFFKKNIEIKYNKTAGKLKIQYSQFKSLPLLIKRFLVNKSFKWPIIRQNVCIINNITKRDVHHLQQKIGLFKVEYS